MMPAFCPRNARFRRRISGRSPFRRYPGKNTEKTGPKTRNKTAKCGGLLAFSGHMWYNYSVCNRPCTGAVRGDTAVFLQGQNGPFPESEEGREHDASFRRKHLCSAQKNRGGAGFDQRFGIAGHQGIHSNSQRRGLREGIIGAALQKRDSGGG